MSVPASFDKEQLLHFIERIESIEESISNHKADIKEIYSEVKSAGYDPKYVKQMVKLRKLDKDEIDEQDEVTKMYRNILGI